MWSMQEMIIISAKTQLSPGKGQYNFLEIIYKLGNCGDRVGDIR